ncbi:MAG TPA: DUF2019 domain-containing protein [Streptosporangiaceae bacterium]|nr:DUF2019 domain-containing protein [Streptosporangiaceae bacterium]
MIASEPVANLKDRYRTLAVEWDEARENPDEANSIFKVHHSVYKILRDTPEGREAIISFMEDPLTPVRLLAATHSLQWQPAQAQAVLEEIMQQTNPYATDAKWTLRSYRNGKLDLDW